MPYILPPPPPLRTPQQHVPPLRPQEPPKFLPKLSIPCRFYASGRCRNGAGCCFQHEAPKVAINSTLVPPELQHARVLFHSGLRFYQQGKLNPAIYALQAATDLHKDLGLPEELARIFYWRCLSRLKMHCAAVAEGSATDSTTENATVCRVRLLMAIKEASKCIKLAPLRIFSYACLVHTAVAWLDCYELRGNQRTALLCAVQILTSAIWTLEVGAPEQIPMPQTQEEAREEAGDAQDDLEAAKSTLTDLEERLALACQAVKEKKARTKGAEPKGNVALQLALSQAHAFLGQRLNAQMHAAVNSMLAQHGVTKINMEPLRVSREEGDSISVTDVAHTLYSMAGGEGHRKGIKAAGGMTAWLVAHGFDISRGPGQQQVRCVAAASAARPVYQGQLCGSSAQKADMATALPDAQCRSCWVGPWATPHPFAQAIGRTKAEAVARAAKAKAQAGAAVRKAAAEAEAASRAAAEMLDSGPVLASTFGSERLCQVRSQGRSPEISQQCLKRQTSKEHHLKRQEEAKEHRIGAACAAQLGLPAPPSLELTLHTPIPQQPHASPAVASPQPAPAMPSDTSSNVTEGEGESHATAHYLHLFFCRHRPPISVASLGNALKLAASADRRYLKGQEAIKEAGGLSKWLQLHGFEVHHGADAQIVCAHPSGPCGACGAPLPSKRARHHASQRQGGSSVEASRPAQPDGPLSSPVDPPRRGICKLFLANACAFGTACWKRHPEGSEAERLRLQYSRQPCVWGSQCKNGWQCLYSHLPPALYVCAKCKMVADHYLNECPQNICFRCGQQGHIATGCTNERLTDEQRRLIPELAAQQQLQQQQQQHAKRSAMSDDGSPCMVPTKRARHSREGILNGRRAEAPGYQGGYAYAESDDMRVAVMSGVIEATANVDEPCEMVDQRKMTLKAEELEEGEIEEGEILE